MTISPSPIAGVHPERPLHHMPQLDGLRALAVACVLYDHWAPPRFGLGNLGISLGGLGVNLFFVLSGFLITGILLVCRRQARGSEGISLAPIGVFYARRALRIFPVYYVLLAILFALDVPPVRQSLPWHAAYLSNVYLCLGSPAGWIGHFWSLAVEEQFYLAWPWIIVFVPERWLERVVLGVIPLGALSRLILFPAFRGAPPEFSVPFSCLESLGVGAWLAVIARTGQIERRRSERRIARLAAIAILPMGLLYWLLWHGMIFPATVFGVTCLAPMLGWVVLRASQGSSSGPFRWLASRPCVEVGRISYAIYLFHVFMPALVRRGVQSVGLIWLRSTVPTIALSLVLTLIAAELSWRLLEGPMNGLKRYLPYDADRAPSAGS